MLGMSSASTLWRPYSKPIESKGNHNRFTVNFINLFIWRTEQKIEFNAPEIFESLTNHPFVLAVPLTATIFCNKQNNVNRNALLLTETFNSAERISY